MQVISSTLIYQRTSNKIRDWYLEFIIDL